VTFDIELPIGTFQQDSHWSGKSDN